jgi:hypothetical protein
MTQRYSKEAIASIRDTSEGIPPGGKRSKNTTQSTSLLNCNKNLAVGAALDMCNAK